jgi:hypothetical protein
MGRAPGWVAKGKTIARLVQELRTFDDQEWEVRISTGDGVRNHPTILVGRHDGVCVLLRCLEPPGRRWWRAWHWCSSGWSPGASRRGRGGQRTPGRPRTAVRTARRRVARTVRYSANAVQPPSVATRPLRRPAASRGA